MPTDPYREEIEDDASPVSSSPSPPPASPSPPPVSPTPPAQPTPVIPPAPPSASPPPSPPAHQPSVAPSRPDAYQEPVEFGAASMAKVEAPPRPEKVEQVEKVVEKVAERPAPREEMAKPSAPPPPPAAPPSAAAPPAKEGAKDLTEDRQLKTLVDLAFSQGLDKAVAAAKASGDAHLIDKFHDTLVDELRQQLIEKGKLKET